MSIRRPIAVTIILTIGLPWLSTGLADGQLWLQFAHPSILHMLLTNPDVPLIMIMPEPFDTVLEGVSAIPEPLRTIRIAGRSYPDKLTISTPFTLLGWRIGDAATGK